MQKTSPAANQALALPIAHELQAATMSSREIAELTGKEHKHILRDIRVMLAELDETSAQIWSDLPDAYGRPQTVAMLSKDLTITLVSGYSVPMRHRIVTRWRELEAQKSVPVHAIPHTFAQALALAAQQAMQLEEQAAHTRQLKDALDSAGPAVDFCDRFVAAEGTQTLTEAAKGLRLPPRLFIGALVADKVLYRSTQKGPLLPAQIHMDKGRFVVKQHVAPDGRSCPQTRVTPVGLKWLAGQYGN